MVGKLDEGLANQKQMLGLQAKMMSGPRLKEFLRSIDLFLADIREKAQVFSMAHKAEDRSCRAKILRATR